MILPAPVAFERERVAAPVGAANSASSLHVGVGVGVGSASGARMRNTRMPTVLGRGAAVYGRTREVAALVLWTLALLFVLALASYQGDPSSAVVATPTPPEPDWVGHVAAFVAFVFVSLVGVVAWALPL